MRAFLSISFAVLALVMSVAGAAPAAHARFDQATAPAGTNFAATANAATDAAARMPLDNSLKSDDAYNVVITKIMTLFAWLLGVAAITLDNAVYYTVVTMGTYVNKLSAIGVAWRILRDLGNIMLIFGFLAVGITTILNVDWYGGGKKMLPMMIVAAVFLNFSLFISEAIIDAGNLFATQFYTQINGGQPAGAKNFDSGSITVSNEGISDKIMGQLGLQTIYGNARTKPALFKDGNPWYMGFMGIILFMVAAFVMFALAFVLVTRFVVLIFLIIVAPIGFAGLAVPQLARRASQWWHTLFDQTVTAPILLLLLYIALAVITDACFLTGFTGASGTCTPGSQPAWDGLVSGNITGFGSLMLSFIVAMGLLLLVVIQAKNLSAAGASWASQTAGKLTFGVTAWGMNRTVGRGAYLLARAARQSEKFNKINAMTGRVMSGTLDRAATGSFDVRGSKAFGGLKSVGLGIDAGTAQKGGFVEARKQNIKAHEEEAKRIEEAHKEALRQTPEDLKAIAKAKEEHDKAIGTKINAQKAKDAAQAAEQEARTLRSKDKAEFDRLAAIDTADRNAGRPSSVGNALREAQQKLKTSEENFATASTNLGKAADALKSAEEAEKTAGGKKTAAEGAAEARMKGSIQTSKTAYAEGISHLLNPITFVAYGPDTAAAARKIKDSLKDKPNREKLADLAKKVIEEEEKEKKASAGGTEETESKPKEAEEKPKPTTP